MPPSARLLAPLTLLLVLGAAPPALTCTISTTPVVFGAYDVLSPSPSDSTGTITFNCLAQVSVVIDLSRGLHASDYFPRGMSRGSGALLDYNLYLDAARTVIWGDNSAGTSHYVNLVPPVLIDFTVTVYGRIPAGVDVPAGSYSDTTVATLVF